MHKMECIENLVKYTLLTGYLKDEYSVPISCILIADPEESKTSIINEVKCKDVLNASDLSPKPMKDIINNYLKPNLIHHILIPDLIKVVAHKPETADSLILFLNQLMEEGVKQGLFFGQEYTLDETVWCGLLTSITTSYFYKVFKKWYDVGFTSRFIPIAYEYSALTTNEIHDCIINSTNSYNEIVIKHSMKRKSNIIIPLDIANWISLHAQDLAKKESGFKYTYRSNGKMKTLTMNVRGFRLHKQLRQLSRAVALSENPMNKEVTWTHINELGEMINYINFPNSKWVI
jgi:hypothetical protein